MHMKDVQDVLDGALNIVGVEVIANSTSSVVML